MTPFLNALKPGLRLAGALALVVICAARLSAEDLQKFDQVQLIDTPWADGDSFLARFPDGKEYTLRIYGADCLESSVNDDSDARRLRAQRRYFGISGYGEEPSKSIALAKSLGVAASEERKRALAKPFTVYTSFADGRGDSHYQRIYAFVTTSTGEDLAELFVKKGLARAYGVARSTPKGMSRDDYREFLKDAELVAARKAVGAWQYTDWESLPIERQAQREEDAELELAFQKEAPLENPVDINHASRDELMRIPGVGETIALAIIEHRPYKTVDELQKVPRIGPKTIEDMRPFLRLGE